MRAAAKRVRHEKGDKVATAEAVKAAEKAMGERAPLSRGSQWLAKMAGEWKGENRMWMNGKAEDSTAYFNAQLVCGDRLISADYIALDATPDGTPVFAGRAVYGYDAKRKVYQMSWVDTMTNSIEFMEGVEVDTRDGKDEQIKVLFEYERHGVKSRSLMVLGDDVHTEEMSKLVDGRWQPEMRIVYTRWAEGDSAKPRVDAADKFPMLKGPEDATKPSGPEETKEGDKGYEVAPPPGAEHAPLHRMLGRFDAAHSGWTGDKRMTSKDLARNRSLCGGRFVETEYESDSWGGMRGFCVYGFDTKHSEYHMLWYDNMSSTMYHYRGHRTSPDDAAIYTIELDSDKRAGALNRAVLAVESDDTHTFDMLRMTDGVLRACMSIRYTKAKFQGGL